MLAQDPDVDYITPNRPVSNLLEFATPAVGGAMARSYGWTGAGIGIAIIDSGISDSNDGFNSSGKTRIVYRKALGTNGTVDVYGHGGAVAGNGSDSSGKYTGVAPQANLVNLRVLSDKGAGNDSQVIAAIDRAIQLKSTYNIRVIKPVARTPCVRELQDRSALSGSGASVEGRHRGRRRSWQ